MTIDMEQLAKSEVEAWTSHDLDKMVAAYTEDCIYEDVALGRIMHGKEEMRAFFKELIAACPDDLSLEINSSFATNNRMCMKFNMRGTIKGSFLGVPATGKAISIRGVHVCELKGDKVSRVSDYWDTSTLMRHWASCRRPLKIREDISSKLSEAGEVSLWPRILENALERKGEMSGASLRVIGTGNPSSWTIRKYQRRRFSDVS